MHHKLRSSSSLNNYCIVSTVIIMSITIVVAFLIIVIITKTYYTFIIKLHTCPEIIKSNQLNSGVQILNNIMQKDKKYYAQNRNN